MKRSAKNTLLTMTAIAMSVAVFCGCGKSNSNNFTDAVNEVTNVVEQTVDQKSNYVDENEDGRISASEIDFSNIPSEFADIDRSTYENLPTLSTVTIEELYSLSIDEFRAFVSLYAPDYRNLYAIDSTKEMKEKDWNNLRSLIGYELFGSIRNPNVSGNDLGYDETLFSDNALLNAQDYASGDDNKKEYIDDLCTQLELIKKMDNDEFSSYMNTVFLEAGYTMEDGSSVDFSMLSENEIEEMKSEIISFIEEEISSYN